MHYLHCVQSDLLGHFYALFVNVDTDVCAAEKETFTAEAPNGNTRARSEHACVDHSCQVQVCCCTGCFA